jgi:tetratricopeptide (TPR) repeat protein
LTILNQKRATTLSIALCCCVFLVQPVKAQSEADALAAIKLATNPTTKLAAAEDFVAKFPNSNARLGVAELIAAELQKIKNGAVALALLERAQAVFTAKQEQEVLKPVALTAYLLGNRPDEAFALAGEMLAQNPNDVAVLARMTQLGAEEARKRNRKYADVSLQYGLKAIALIEADKKPANLKDLGQLYQQTAILYLGAGNTQEARSRLEKAASLLPNDPGNFALLGRVINADYVTQFSAYESMPDGKAKQDEGRRLDSVLDVLIDNYARAAGLATGRAEYQTLLQQVIPDLTTYYKRRNGSVKGLQELIRRYSAADSR